jgi:hypothetical protein
MIALADSRYAWLSTPSPALVHWWRLCAMFFGLRVAHCSRMGDRARGHGVDSDIAATQLIGQHLDQPLHARLGSDIGAIGRKSLGDDAAREGDDTSAGRNMPGRLAQHHEGAAAGLEPLEWLLLTTCAVQTPEDAIERMTWYACRWGIEVWHKGLKSGCRLEARQLETAERLRRWLAVYSVLAWRILYATLLSRALPDVPCTALLEPEEWQALYCAIHVTSTPPTTPPPRRQAVHWIGRLGGFLARRADGEPGVTVLWRGFQHLTDLTLMYRIMRPPPRKPHNVGKA